MTPGDDVLEALRVFTVGRIIPDCLNELVEAIDGKVVDFDELADFVVRDASGDAGLVESDGDRDHGNAVRQRLERCVESGVRDAERGALEQLDLRRFLHDDEVGGSRAQIAELHIPTDGENGLYLGEFAQCGQNSFVDALDAVDQRSQRSVDQWSAVELLPGKWNWGARRIVEEWAGVVKLRRPGTDREVELPGRLRNDGQPRGGCGRIAPINRETDAPGVVDSGFPQIGKVWADLFHIFEILGASFGAIL